MTAMMMGSSLSAAAESDFKYTDERFADLQMLRYKVPGFEDLSLKQKTFIYYLQEAALWGRDILWDQNGKYNLRVRRVLEEIYKQEKRVRTGNESDNEEFQAFETFLKRVWFSNGIHHHYACDKFVPGFSSTWFIRRANEWAASFNDVQGGYEALLNDVCEVIFNPNILQKRINLAEGVDLIKTSASNYYEGVTQAEAEAFYEKQKAEGDALRPVMYGMNSRLVKDSKGRIFEKKWTINGLYGSAIKNIVDNLLLAREYAEDEKQKEVIDLLVKYYRTGDLKTFDDYSIAWAENTAPQVDFVNGFIECYGDPLGLKCSWESLVNFKDLVATKRTETLSKNAQWFEDHSPVDKAFKKDKVKGVSAKVINAALLAGDLYPSTAIGINLPNSNWIRREHGSKSVTIGNITNAYNQAAKGNGMRDEFVLLQSDKDLLEKYADVCDELHTDLHECLGHGSGKLLNGVDPDSLKAYGSTIEEARADLFALYYLPDAKLVELGLTPSPEAYKAGYYAQMQNGLMTQLVRIQPGNNLEEAHMRNRALIAHWAFEHGKADNVCELIKQDGKTYLRINDYEKLRVLFGKLLSEIQRIKSTGDYQGAKVLVEEYGVKVDPVLHKEILERYAKLNIAPYKGFINPKYTAVKDKDGKIVDVKVSYSERYEEQMMRYSTNYSALPLVNE